MRSGSQDCGLAEDIVAADADDKVGGVGRQVVQLAIDVRHGAAIDSAEGRSPRGRQFLPELSDDVRAATDIGSIVEDRIAQQNDMRHDRTLRARFAGECDSAAAHRQKSPPGPCHVIEAHSPAKLPCKCGSILSDATKTRAPWEARVCQGHHRHHGLSHSRRTSAGVRPMSRNMRSLSSARSRRSPQRANHNAIPRSVRAVASDCALLAQRYSASYSTKPMARRSWSSRTAPARPSEMARNPAASGTGRRLSLSAERTMRAMRFKAGSAHRYFSSSTSKLQPVPPCQSSTPGTSKGMAFVATATDCTSAAGTNTN